MKVRVILAVSVVVTGCISLCLLRPAWRTQKLAAPSGVPPSAQIRRSVEGSRSGRPTNDLGDIVADGQSPEFVNKVFPKLREFVATLDRLGVSPFQNPMQISLCKRVRIIRTPHGMICPFLIGEDWTADYTETETFSGITRFGQRGQDNPFRAISRADMNALRRLSEGAVKMSDTETWRIANRVADGFGIDRTKFEHPQMHEEGLFEHNLGLRTVRYRVKGSDPVNQLNYTRSFSLKATSPTSAVIVSYIDLDLR